MKPIESFFAEFPPVDKAAWLAKITKDLRDKPIDALYWPMREGLVVDPFGHPDDQARPPEPLSPAAGGWEICETIDAGAPDANAVALQALQSGVEALDVHIPVQGADLSALLADVHPDMIGLYFSGPGVQSNPGKVFADLSAFSATRNLDTKSLRGALPYDPAGLPAPADWRYLAELIVYAKETFPEFRVIGFESPAGYQGPEDTVGKLAFLLRRADHYIRRLAERGIAPADTAAQMECGIRIGPSYFTEIAALRAFSILWMNLLQGWDVPPALPRVQVRFHPEAYTDALYTNMIRATTMAMSAVLGGAHRLTVLPYDAGREAQATYPQAFGRRIARNVQHLLRLESFLDEVNDPAAGSYYIESLTKQLAEAAWTEFTQP